MGVFHVFLNCTNGTKSHNAPHLPIIWKWFFDFDMKLCNSTKWNDKELMFKWNKEKKLPLSFKVEFTSLILRYLEMLFSESTVLMKCLALKIAGIANEQI